MAKLIGAFLQLFIRTSTEEAKALGPSSNSLLVGSSQTLIFYLLILLHSFKSDCRFVMDDVELRTGVCHLTI
jgi:hypothetical protein